MNNNNKEISYIVDGWDYTPGKITARWIKGNDGLPKVQLRLDLGVLQMEMNGRPDGTSPYGFGSLLDYYLALEEKTQTDHPSIVLTEEACNALQQETVQYYYRYLAFYALGYLDGVIRDTGHNLELFDFVARHSLDEDLVWQFLQFLPYVRMMNARASSERFVQQKDHVRAIKAVEDAVTDIQNFWHEYGDPEEEEPESEELDILTELLDSLRKKRPKSQTDRLKEDLDKAIRSEDYEQAARLRDALRQIEEKAKTS